MTVRALSSRMTFCPRSACGGAVRTAAAARDGRGRVARSMRMARLQSSSARRRASPTRPRSPTSAGASSRASTRAWMWSSLSHTGTSCSTLSPTIPSRRCRPPPSITCGRISAPRARRSFAACRDRSLLARALSSRDTWPRKASNWHRTRASNAPPRNAGGFHPLARRLGRREPASSTGNVSSSLDRIGRVRRLHCLQDIEPAGRSRGKFA